jgi:capsular exopolysaccharide synthesis family protein
MDNGNNDIAKHFERNESLNIRAELEKYLSYWKWIVLSVAIFLTCAFLYLRYSTPAYTVSTKIMIKDNKKGGKSLELAAFEQLGVLGGTTNNIDDEIEVFKSRKIVGNVVNNLDLTISYFLESRIKKFEVYKNDRPVILVFTKDSTYNSNFGTSLIIKPINNQTYELREGEDGVTKTYNFGEEVSCRVGNFVLFLNKNKKFESRIVTVNVSPINSVIDRYKNGVSLSTVNKKATVIIVTLTDAVKAKAEDVLNNLVDEYNKDAIFDKNQVSKNTKDFIEKRLSKIQTDLSSIDLALQNYQDTNNITDIQFESGLLLEANAENLQKINKLETQVYLSKQISEVINTGKDFQLLPSLLIDDPTIFKFVDDYNNLILRRNRLTVNAGKQNPMIIDLENQLTKIKGSLVESLKNFQNNQLASLNQLKKESSRILDQKSKIPATLRGLIDVRRQQAIIAELFTFLLKKKEETAISLAITVPPAKIIDRAYGSSRPVSPKRKKIYILYFFVGIIIPIAIIYLKDLLDNKIHSKKEIEDNTSAPFLGDIPKSTSKEKIVIGNNVRSSTAEAFRLVRTNLDFMLAGTSKSENGNKSIFITSTTSGEGKSFISINLAATLALSGKKILLLGMDLRAPKITEYLEIPNKKGVTNYITDDTIKIDDLKFNIPQVPELDIISSGVVPPNPAELLLSPKIDELFAHLKKQYDFIVVDTAPVNLVTDTLLISKFADMFLYIVRANYLDKRLLAVPEDLYKNKRLPNISVVLNDTDPKRSYGYGGYGYGGYGYGGYGYGQDIGKKPWYKKIFSR